MPRARRRDVLGGAMALAGASLLGCAQNSPMAGIVAIPERSVTYAPLLLAVTEALNAPETQRIGMMQRSSGRPVAELVASGAVSAGGISLPELLDAVAEGAPLVAIAALTRRLPAHFMIAPSRFSAAPTLDALRDGLWRGVRVGVEIGPNGTEAAVRMASSSILPLMENAAPALTGRIQPARDSLRDEPRWIGFETGEALVAALADKRVDAFVAGPLAAVQSLTLGDAEVVPEWDLVAAWQEVVSAFPALLIAHRDAAAREDSFLRRVVAACARAATILSGSEREDQLRRALPERDGLHLGLAARLLAPTPAESAYVTAGAPLALGPAIERYLTLSAKMGRAAPRPGTASSLVSTRFSG